MRKFINKTQYTPSSINAVLDAILKHGAWEDFPCMFVFEPVKRQRRVSIQQHFSSGKPVVRVLMPNTCTGKRLGLDLHWQLAKHLFHDDPGKYLHDFSCPGLEKKSATKQEQGRDRMLEGKLKAEDHVKRIARELLALDRAKARKEKLLKKWQAKVKASERRLAQRTQENAWKERVQKKAQAMKEELDSTGIVPVE